MKLWFKCYSNQEKLREKWNECIDIGNPGGWWNGEIVSFNFGTEKQDWKKDDTQVSSFLCDDIVSNNGCQSTMYGSQVQDR